MRMWTKVVGLALLCAALSVAPARAAVTWTVVTNNDCTGLGAASGLTNAQVNCCVGAAPNAQNFCDYRDTFGGTAFARLAYVAASGTYTTGGDAITAAQLAKLGFNTIIYASCNQAVMAGSPATATAEALLVRTATGGKIQLFEATATGTVAAPTISCTGAGVSPTAALTVELASDANSVALNCGTTARTGITGIQAPAFTGTVGTFTEAGSGATVTNAVLNCLVIGR